MCHTRIRLNELLIDLYFYFHQKISQTWCTKSVFLGNMLVFFFRSHDFQLFQPSACPLHRRLYFQDYPFQKSLQTCVPENRTQHRRNRVTNKMVKPSTRASESDDRIVLTFAKIKKMIRELLVKRRVGLLHSSFGQALGDLSKSQVEIAPFKL